MAKLTGSTTEPNTPASKKGGTSKNAFPTFTPAATRVTRAQAKAIGMEVPIALDLQASTRKPKKTKIPPGVGLEQIPSPGNLKVVCKTRGAAKDKVAVEDVIDDLGALELGGKGKKKGGASKATGAKKGKEVAKVQESEELKASRTTRFNTVVKHEAKGKGKGKRVAPPVSDSDDNMEFFDINPVVPPALKPRTARSASTTSKSAFPASTSSSTSDADNEVLLTSLAPFMSSKKLWDMDDADVTELRKAAAETDKDSEAEFVLKGMLNVVEKFQAFRDGLDEYMEDMEELGYGLDWEGDGVEREE